MIIENTRFVLGINEPMQSDFSKKVKNQTKRGTQMNKRTATSKMYHYHQISQIRWNVKTKGGTQIDKRTVTGRDTQNKYLHWFHREVASGSQIGS